MKYRLGAAIAALALVSIPVAVAADQSSWMLVTDVDQQEHLVTGLDHLWSQLTLVHQVDTVHEFIPFSSIRQFPPGPCRQVAIRWDAAVIASSFSHTQRQQERSQTQFERILSDAADNNCSIDFTRDTTGNADGSFDMLSAAPSTQ